MKNRSSIIVCMLLSGLLFQALAGIDNENTQLAIGGKAVAVIVAGKRSGEFDRWVAGELQTYIEKLSGAKLSVVDSDAVPVQGSIILLGRPETNPLIADAKDKQLIDYSALKAEGMLIKTVDIEGRNALVVSGADEAGMMYAAYDLLERLGIVFQIANDVIPNIKPDLNVPPLNICDSPAFKHRGMHTLHGMGTWNMGLADYRHHLDQMAKMKMNRFNFMFGMTENVWNRFSYKGRTTDITNPSVIASNYVSWAGTTATFDAIRVGRECFPTGSVTSPEFADVKTSDDAYNTAREFLSEIIRYAHSRKIEVWVTVGAIPDVPVDLVPSELKDKVSMHWGGARMPAGHPDTIGIYEAAIEQVLKDHPDIDGISILGAEESYDTSDADTQKLVSEFAWAKDRMPTLEGLKDTGLGHVFGRNTWNERYNKEHGTNGSALDADFAEACLAAKLFKSVRSRHSDVRLIMCTLFRPYMARVMDDMMPEGVVLMSLETLANDRPVMHFFGDVKKCEFVIMPRIGHDGGQQHYQLNLFQYEYDQILTGMKKYNCDGFIGQLIKERGFEINSRYFAEGAWNPELKLLEFYPDYLSRLFGEQASPVLSRAYIYLDYNMGSLSVYVQRMFATAYSHTDFFPLTYVNKLYSKYDAASIRNLKRSGQYVLPLLQKSREQVYPGSLRELDYVIYKVSCYNDYLEVTALRREAQDVFFAANEAKKKGDIEAYKKGLADCDRILGAAEKLVMEVGRQMIPFCDDVSERHLLVDLNMNPVAHIELSRKYLAGLMKDEKMQGEYEPNQKENQHFQDAEALLE